MAVHGKRVTKHLPKRPATANDIAVMDADADKALRRLRTFLTEYFGERCPDFDKDCPCCRVWVRYDLLEEELG